MKVTLELTPRQIRHLKGVLKGILDTQTPVLCRSVLRQLQKPSPKKRVRAPKVTGQNAMAEIPVKRFNAFVRKMEAFNQRLLDKGYHEVFWTFKLGLVVNTVTFEIPDRSKILWQELTQIIDTYHDDQPTRSYRRTAHVV